MRKTTKRSKKVQEILYSTFRGNRATVYGAEVTRQEYGIHQQQTGHPHLTVDKCGLCISVNTPWLAATPDGMVCDPSNPTQPLGLLEINNPFSARQLTLAEACNSRTFCLEQQQRCGDVTYKLKKIHDYYHSFHSLIHCYSIVFLVFNV